MIDPLGNATVTGFDEASNPVSVTDANGNVTGWVWDAMNRLTEVTGGDGAQTGYSYDQLGNMVSRTDPNQNVTTYGWDAMGRMVETIDPLGRKITHAWDADGNLIESITARGHKAADAGGDPAPWTVGYGYDGRGLRTTIESPDASVAAEFGYDKLARPTTVADHLGTTTYTWDPGSRLTGLVRRGPGGGLTEEFGYGYDRDGHVTSRTYPDGSRITASFDADGRQTTSARDGTGTVELGWNAAGQMTGVTYPDGGNGAWDQTRVFDPAGRLAEIATTNPTGGYGSRYQITRDGAGNPTRIDTSGTNVPAPGTRTYSYDQQNRLTSVCHAVDCDTATTSITYGYDQVGNKLTETRQGTDGRNGLHSFAYDNADQLTSHTSPSGETDTYEFDADGNLTAFTDPTIGTTSYTFDVANRLTAQTHPDGTSVDVTYDALDLRRTVSSTATDGTGETRDYAWDINHQFPMLAAQTNPWNTKSVRYTETSTPIPLEVFRNPDDPTDLIWLTQDHLDSTAETRQPDGTPAWATDYEPYGKRSITKHTTAIDPMLHYNSQYHDPTLGTIHLRARDYHTFETRFTAKDPQPANPTDPYTNTYHYANNNPLTNTDPSGERVGTPTVRETDSYGGAGGIPGVDWSPGSEQSALVVTGPLPTESIARLLQATRIELFLLIAATVAGGSDGTLGGAPGPCIVYIKGNLTPMNFTPRNPQDLAGLSAWDSLEAIDPETGLPVFGSNDKYQAINVKALEGGLKAIIDDPESGHVSIVAEGRMLEWARTRQHLNPKLKFKDEEPARHELTKLLFKAWVESGRMPK